MPAPSLSLAPPTTALDTILGGADCILWHGEVCCEGEDTLWEIVPANPHAVYELLGPEAVGLAPNALLALWLSRLPEEDLLAIDRDNRAALERDEHERCNEFRIRDCRGRLRRMYERVRFEKLTPNRWRAVGVLFDLTEQKQIQLLTTSQSRVLEMIATGESLPTILEELCRQIEALVPGSMSSILGFDPQTQTVHNLCGPSLPDGYQQRLEGLVVGPNDGSCGAAIARGECVISADLTTDPLWENYRCLAVDTYGLRACWSQPVLDSAGAVLGTYAIYHRHPHAPDPLEREILRVAAHLAGVALERDAQSRALALSQADIRQVLTSARCLLYHADVADRHDGTYEWRLHFVNREAAQQVLPLEVSATEDYCSAFLAARWPDDRPVTDGNARAALTSGAGGFVQEFRCTDRYGRLRWLREEITLTPVGPGRWSAAGVCTDVTARHQAEEIQRGILAGARCLLWHAEVEEDPFEDRLTWNVRPVNVASFRQVMPLEGDTPEQYWESFYRVREVESGPVTATHVFRSGAAGYQRSYRVVDSAGVVHWLHEEVNIQPTGTGRWNAVGLITDVTERKEAERVLEHTLAGARCILWHGTIQARDDGYHWTFQFPHIAAAQRFLGLTTQNHRDLMIDLHRGIPAEDEAAMEDRYLEAIRTGASGYSQVFRYQRPDGQVRRLYEDVRLERSGPDRWQAVGVITEVASAWSDDLAQSQMLRDLAASREQYHKLFVNSPVGIYRAMAGGRIIMANPALLRMLAPDVPVANAIVNNDRGLSALDHPSYQQESFRQPLARGGEIQGWEGQWRRSDGSRVVVRENARAVRADDGTLLFYEGIVEDITERRAAEDHIQWQATHDALTRLPNRRLFAEQLEHALADARSSGEQVAIAFIDLDRFKQINDTLGHSAGDRLLVSVSERLRHAVRATDGIFRMGGDEFTVLLTGADPAAAVSRVARAIRRTLNAPIHLDGFDCVLSGSIGVSLFPRDGEDAATLLRHADIAMYRVKQQGGDGFEFFQPRAEDPMRDRLRLEADLRYALSRNELQVWYQPQIETRTGRVIGVEALLRWRHPERGLILPSEFIPLAEESGLILSIGEWVLRTASADAARWRREGLSLRVAVNVSPRQLGQRSLPRRVAAILYEFGVDPEHLCLELTETALLSSGKNAARALAALKALGVRLQLDDFGTGYSSLALLRDYAMDALKIDRMFVDGVARGGKDAAVVEAVIGLGRALGMEVIAEGVETLAQERRLIEFGCDAMQGFLFSEAVPADSVPDLLRTAALSQQRAA